MGESQQQTMKKINLDANLYDSYDSQEWTTSVKKQCSVLQIISQKKTQYLLIYGNSMHQQEREIAYTSAREWNSIIAK